ncbi:MAG TPA: hypothetical protein VHY83_04050 [Solirubrobacteraceae bacterium]|jgi:hypothetical protein|nr:hypothetical protein [Solirubrobacteraceae bacterium]
MSSLPRTLADRADPYQSLSNFYRADRRRRASREQDVGLWWRVGAHGPIYRAAWVRDTGELYVTRLGALQDGSREVLVLGRARDRDELDAALEGWQDVCPQPDSMTWLQHRATQLEAPEKPPASLAGEPRREECARKRSPRRRRAAALRPSAETSL